MNHCAQQMVCDSHSVTWFRGCLVWFCRLFCCAAAGNCDDVEAYTNNASLLI